MSSRVLTLGVIVASFLFPDAAVFASVFPDVPDGHIFQEAVEQLAGAQVVNGNPDGTFAPDRTVNRAEMLMMLYRAQGIMPDPASVRCFADISVSSWYEQVVCDAASRRFVQGYSDGLFRPENPVNRVEALKMNTEVLGVGVGEIDEEQRGIVKFVDVSISAWYTKYLFAAYAKGILPIPGQSGSRFSPEQPLLRGEAAAYIHNALRVDVTEERQEREEAQAQSRSSQAASPGSMPAAGGQSSQASSATVLSADFPFDASGKFRAKMPFSYRFSLPSPTTVSVVTALQSGQPGSVSCRLYLLQEDGISDQYFLGYQEGGKCYILAALSAGDYQLQLQPTSADTTFTVVAAQASGDGNDGFTEADSLQNGMLHTENLSGGDFQDWFSFTDR